MRFPWTTSKSFNFEATTLGAFKPQLFWSRISAKEKFFVFVFCFVSCFCCWLGHLSGHHELVPIAPEPLDSSSFHHGQNWSSNRPDNFHVLFLGKERSSRSLQKGKFSPRQEEKSTWVWHTLFQALPAIFFRAWSQKLCRFYHGNLILQGSHQVKLRVALAVSSDFVK